MWPKIEIKLITIVKEMLVTFATPIMNGNLTFILKFHIFANFFEQSSTSNPYAKSPTPTTPRCTFEHRRLVFFVIRRSIAHSVQIEFAANGNEKIFCLEWYME